MTCSERIAKTTTGGQFPGRGEPQPQQERGQMSVELAVLMPVIIVVALVVYNLARFVALCATFDRAAFNAVSSFGVAPTGTQTSVVAVDQVERNIAQSLGAGDAFTVRVSANRVQADGSSSGMSLAPHLYEFTCKLFFKPWPSAFVIVGVPFNAPVVLLHERTLVVDRYSPGVVM